MKSLFPPLISILFPLIGHAEVPSSIPGITQELITTGQLTVDAKANIYGATKTQPPGGGLLPAVFEFTPGEYQLFIPSNITGQVSCCDNLPLYNGPDGGSYGLGHTRVPTLGGIAGVEHPTKTMFLVGLFTDDQGPGDSVPERTLDCSLDCEDFDSYNTALHVPFFIGDGKNSRGHLQAFNIPPQATKLYLGFVDGDDTGQVGSYDDNQGQLKAEFGIYYSLSYTGSDPPQITKGLIAHYSFDAENLLKDSSGFNFNGDYPIDASQKLGAIQGKYGNAINFPFSLPADREIPLVSSLFPRTSTKKDEWSIATWFYQKSSNGGGTGHYSFVVDNLSNESVSYSSQCGAVVVENHELGTAYCIQGYHGPGIAYRTFNGSQFYLNTLAEGWHHLVVVGQQNDTPRGVAEGKNSYYIDGQLVGTSAFGGYRISRIGAEGLILDEFNVYNRALSTEEIALLSSVTSVTPKNTLPVPSMEPGFGETAIDYYRDEVTGDVWKDLPAWRLSTEGKFFPEAMWKYGLRSIYLAKYACWDSGVRDWMPNNIINGIYYCTNPEDRQQTIDFLQIIISKLQTDMKSSSKD